MELPPLLVDGAREALQALEQVTLVGSRELSARHAELFADFRHALEALFIQYAYTPSPTEDVGNPPARWNSAAVQRQGLLSELNEMFIALLDGLEDADAALFAETLPEAADDGYGRGLWLLALAGVDVGDYADLDTDWEPELENDGFDDANWESRLTTWGAVTGNKMQRWLGAAALSEMPWQDSLDGVDRLLTSHTQHVAGLFGNEMFRAFTLGSLLAATLVGRTTPLVEIWLTRQDGLVCPLCAERHNTITLKRPIDDSHPGCRCIKVSLPATFVPSPVAYTSFRPQGDV